MSKKKKIIIVRNSHKYFSDLENSVERIIEDIKENQSEFLKILEFIEEKAEQELEKNNSKVFGEVKKDLNAEDYIKKMYEMIDKGGFDAYLEEIEKQRKSTFWQGLKKLGKSFLKGLAFENAVKYGIKNALMFIVPGITPVVAPVITGVGIAIAAYHLYKDAKIANEMKKNLLSKMSDSLKEKLKKLFEVIQKTVQVCKSEKNNSKTFSFYFYNVKTKFYSKCMINEEKMKDVHLIVNTYIEKGIKDAEKISEKIGPNGEYKDLINAIKDLDREIKNKES